MLRSLEGGGVWGGLNRWNNKMEEKQAVVIDNRKRAAC